MYELQSTVPALYKTIGKTLQFSTISLLELRKQGKGEGRRGPAPFFVLTFPAPCRFLVTREVETLLTSISIV